VGPNAYRKNKDKNSGPAPVLILLFRIRGYCHDPDLSLIIDFWIGIVQAPGLDDLMEFESINIGSLWDP
jgi:hypothetical protein